MPLWFLLACSPGPCPTVVTIADDTGRLEITPRGEEPGAVEVRIEGEAATAGYEGAVDACAAVVMPAGWYRMDVRRAVGSCETDSNVNVLADAREQVEPTVLCEGR
ncbi:MAG: hypothetical protein ACOZNI_08940 [Myxococcota bacterium]